MAELSPRERVIALRWQRRGQIEALAPALESAFPIEQASSFDSALLAIDNAEAQVWGDGDPGGHRGD